MQTYEGSNVKLWKALNSFFLQLQCSLQLIILFMGAQLCSCCMQDSTVDSTDLKQDFKSKQLPNKETKRSDTERVLYNKYNSSSTKQNQNPQSSRPPAPNQSRYSSKVSNPENIAHTPKSILAKSSSGKSLRGKFIETKEYQSFLNGSTDISQLLSTADQAMEKQLFDQSAKIYAKILVQIERSRQLSPETKDELNLFVKLELISILQEKQSLTSQEFQMGQSLFHSCLQLYQKLPESKVFEEKITVLNNFAVFYRKNQKFDKAIEVCEKTLKMEEKFYTHFDERKYFTLVNLACFYYEDQRYQFGDNITDYVLRECPINFQEIRKIAQQNQTFFHSNSNRKASRIR